MLFIGGTRYSQPLDPTHEKKIRTMAQNLEMTFIAFHQERGFMHFYQDAEFFLASPKIVNYLRQLYFLVYAFFKARTLIKERAIPLVICQSPFEGVCGALLTRWCKGLKLIIEIHGEWDKAPIAYRRLTRRLKWLSDGVGCWAMRRSDALRVISEATLNTVKDLSKHKKVFTFPTYTDIELFLEAEDQEIVPYRFIFIGQLVRLKGIDTIIEAVAILKERGVKIEVLLVGEGPDANRFGNRIKELGMEGQFMFLGLKGQKEAAGLIKTSVALTLPSFTEGFGRVIIEAFACGRPALGSRVGAIPELIKDGENGFLIEPGDAEALADKMTHILQNPGQAKRMGQRGRRFVERNFSTRIYLSHYVDMIKDVLIS